MSNLLSIQKVLIANRGEIACRVIRTCQRLNIQTVAIYSEVDEHSLHVRLASEAYCIGPAPASQSYLHIDKIIAIAKQSQAQAIHPGYGFLSENAPFAKACLEAGLIFIGPHHEVIDTMGDKAKAKTLMQKAGVPIIPGLEFKTLEKKQLQDIEEMGFPVIIKAAFGGGGKGMRIVHAKSELQDAIHSTQRESLSHFGSDKVIIEKYIPFARHIEVQIFGDNFNNVVHLFERDCSLQRRHQKIIEETPALLIAPEHKNKLYEAALKAARALNYTNAGTIEFLYDPQQKENNFYFLEINTRLQVEHAVTEMTTGLDLVEWQLIVAANQALPLTQKQIKQTGHAIEVRIYAEDPHKDFLPATGKIIHLVEPDHAHTLDHYRLESGIQQNDTIGIYYDPLLSKIIVSGEDRNQAIERLKNILNHYEVMGVTTNLSFLRQILVNPDFLSGDIYTNYLNDNANKNLNTILQASLHSALQYHVDLLAPAVLAFVLKQQSLKNHFSPWHKKNAWQLNGPSIQHITLMHDGKKIKLSVQHPSDESDNYILTGSALKKPVHAQASLQNNTLHYNHTPLPIAFNDDKTRLYLFQNGQAEHYELESHRVQSGHGDTASKNMQTAALPGVITRIWIQPGEHVKKGDKIMAIEAMKMEHTLCAHQAGIIKSIYYQVGDQLQEGCLLFEFEGEN